MDRLIVEVNEPVFDRGYRLETPTEDQAEPLDRWRNPFTFVREGVWQKIEIKPFRLAVLDGKVTP